MFVKFECENFKRAILDNYREKIDPAFEGQDINPDMMEKFDLLDMNDYGITSIEGIQYAKNLRHLYMANNEIKDLTPLKECNKLEILDFQKNQVEDIWPLELLRRLESLNIAYNNITDVMALNDIANIDSINISGNTIENRLPLRHIRFVKK